MVSWVVIASSYLQPQLFDRSRSLRCYLVRFQKEPHQVFSGGRPISATRIDGTWRDPQGNCCAQGLVQEIR